MSKYLTNLKYQGKNGVIVWVRPVKREGQRLYWVFKFNSKSKIEFTAKTKFDALCFAAWMHRRSMEKMDWRAIQ